MLKLNIYWRMSTPMKPDAGLSKKQWFGWPRKSPERESGDDPHELCTDSTQVLVADGECEYSCTYHKSAYEKIEKKTKKTFFLIDYQKISTFCEINFRRQRMGLLLHFLQSQQNVQTLAKEQTVFWLKSENSSFWKYSETQMRFAMKNKWKNSRRRSENTKWLKVALLLGGRLSALPLNFIRTYNVNNAYKILSHTEPGNALRLF